MYPQKSLLTLDDILDLQPKSKLDSILAFVNHSIIEQEFERSSSSRGPKGYSPKCLTNALLAMKLGQYHDVKQLVYALKTNPTLRMSCRFTNHEKVPSQATFSRFITRLSTTNILEQIYQVMVQKAMDAGLIDGKYLSIDASKIDSYEHAIPISKIPENDKDHPRWGVKFDTNMNQTKWYGWKQHAIVDSKSRILLGHIVTPVNVADMSMAIPLMRKIQQDYNKKIKPSYYLMDAGYDIPEIYKVTHEEFKAQAIIPLNWRNTKVPPTGVNFRGQLVCSLEFPFTYGGRDRNSIRLLCPHSQGKVDCPMGSHWCTSCQSGYIGKVAISKDPRFVTAPLRETNAWQEIYN